MAGKVTILPFNETFDVEDGESLLWSILRHGRYVRYGCKSGGCSTCRAQIVEGDCRLGLQTSYSLSDHDRATGIVLLCSSFLDAGDVVVDVADTMDLTEEQYHAGQEVTEYRAEVDRLDPLTHDIRWLGLRLQGSAAMPFSAGQYVEVAVPGSVDEWRSYSMANGPEDDGRVDLVIKVIPGGRFSTGLDERLRRGDEVRLRGPFGQFGVRLSHRPMVMVAGGSGMAPILA